VSAMRLEMGSKMGIWMDGKFRDKIHERDHWKCRMCGLKVGRGAEDASPVLGKLKALPGEGIYGKAKVFEINHQPENLMTLCLICQKKNTARLSSERVHGTRKMAMDGRTFERILNEALKRGLDVETCIVQWMDELSIPGESGITGIVYDKEGKIKDPAIKGPAWVLKQKERPAVDRGPVQEPGPVVPVVVPPHVEENYRRADGPNEPQAVEETYRGEDGLPEV